MANVVSRVVGFLRAGYPSGLPATGYAPLFALLRRRVSDDEIAAITECISAGGVPFGAVDVGVEISRITNDMPSLNDIGRVHDRLIALGWRADHGA